MAQKNTVNVRNNGEFRHETSIGEHGEILYDAPIEIMGDEDMANYGISDKDCRYIHFGESEKVRVYFYKTDNQGFAESQWNYIDSLHRGGYRKARCMVPGKRKTFVRCRDTNKCSECPYGRNPETKQGAEASLDDIIDKGWEPVPEESVESKVLARMEYEEIRALMDAEDARIARALEAKVLYGDSVREIAGDLGVSEPRVYQFLRRAKEIGRVYREKGDA